MWLLYFKSLFPPLFLAGLPSLMIIIREVKADNKLFPPSLSLRCFLIFYYWPHILSLVWTQTRTFTCILKSLKNILFSKNWWLHPSMVCTSSSMWINSLETQKSRLAASANRGGCACVSSRWSHMTALKCFLHNVISHFLPTDLMKIQPN